MNRLVRTAVAVSALLLVIVAMAYTRGGAGDDEPEPAPTPIVGLDDCPSPAELLAPGDRPRDGDRLPDVTLECIGDGPDVALRALGRQPTVVNLWASWCEPCRKEMPALQQVYRRMGGKVRLLGIDVKDGRNSGRRTIQFTGVTYPSLFDPDDVVRKSLGGLGMPRTYFVRADGRVAGVRFGELTADEFAAAIAEYLGVKV